jgi:hypothetical protein
MANGAGIAVAPSPNALAGADLYNLRLDVEGLPYNRAATLKQPPAAAAEAAHRRLRGHPQFREGARASAGPWLPSEDALIIPYLSPHSPDDAIICSVDAAIQLT